MEVVRHMMTAVVQRGSSTDSMVSSSQVPPSVLLIGKKRTLDYISPAVYRMNNFGELVIKAIGSLSIVTAVDVAEIVKRDLAHIATQSITVGTNELKIATGELRRMSSIEIHLIKVYPITVAPPSVRNPMEEGMASPVIEIPISEAAVADDEVPVVVEQEKAKKPRSKRKPSSATKKKSSGKKRKSIRRRIHSV